MDLDWRPDVFLEWLPYQIPQFLKWSEGLIKYSPAACAFLWLLFRGLQIVQKPAAELGDLLGLDVPPPPDVSLTGIRDTEIDLTWKPPEAHNSTAKHIIQVNGINVGETSRSETTITVYGLNPGNLYNIRVISVNSADFQTSGSLIRLQTSPPRTCDNPGSSTRQSHTISNHGAQEDRYPGVRPQAPPVELFTPAATSAVIREGGNALSSGRRSLGRRNSPAAVNIDSGSRRQSETDARLDEVGISIQELTAKLKTLQQETEDIEEQIAKEEIDYQEEMEALQKQRSSLKQALKDKEEASSKLKKELANLNSINRAAQSNKTATEKVLEQKEDERKNMREDLARWGKEIEIIKEQTRGLKEEKAKLEQETASKLETLKKILDDNQSAIRSLEEDIRVKGVQLHELEDQKKHTGENIEDTEAYEIDQMVKEKDFQWDARFKDLQSKYVSMHKALQHSLEEREQASQALQWLLQRRSSQPDHITASPVMDFDPSAMTARVRRNIQRRSRASTMSSQPGSFPIHDSYSSSHGLDNISTISPTFPTPSYYGFNHSISNSFTIPMPADRPIFQSHEDSSFDGMPMSPTADSLLPSGLLGDTGDDGDDETPISRVHEDLPISRPTEDFFLSRPRPSTASSLPLGRSPFISRLVPAAGLSGAENFNSTSQSPDSPSSPSASGIASPQTSTSKLSFPIRPDRNVQGDVLSIRSNNALGEVDHAESTRHSKRFANIFGFNRQRGKTVSAEPPILGSLKSGQSQSFPRNLEQPDFPFADTRPRRGSAGGFTNSLSSLWSRGSGIGHNIGDRSSVLSRRSPLNLFGSKYEPSFGPIGSPLHSKAPSPRPPSTLSQESVLRASTETQPFGWPPSDHLGAHGGSAFGWASDAFSRSQSRRQSIQYGSSTTHLPLDDDIIEDQEGHYHHEQPPIGTPRQRTLNPKAPSFSLFKRESKRSDKEAKETANKEPHNPIPQDGDDLHDTLAQFEVSPKSHRSHDGRSLVTVPSTSEQSRNSLERTTSGTPSFEAPLSASYTSNSNRDSFIQKLTRKSSYSKFNMPWSKANKKVGEQVETPEEGQQAASSSLYGDAGKSVDSVASSAHSVDRSNRGSRSWNRLVNRKNKKGKDKENDEMAERASETEDNDGDDED
ncbi:MAG: hypothetical protein M1834_005875 [Cirrosporium novae-zelandiae]|nr:MAG: hypothetical protein M1834_005875 [Cirrosporium novae-zelandiae]